MQLVRHHDPAAFLQAAAPLLARNGAFAAWLESLLAARRRSHDDERCLMLSWSSGTDHGVAFQRNEGPLVLGGEPCVAITTLCGIVADELPALDAITGPLDACEAFASAWQVLTGRVASHRMRMRNHRLARLVTPRGVPGAIRSATQEDAEWLLAMLRAFATEADVQVHRATLQRQIHERLDADGYRLWEVGEERVALTGFGHAGANASRIASVYTLPAFRGHRYASALVAATCSEILRTRQAIYLVTDASDPVPNAVYRRLGFEALDETHAFEFEDPA